MHRVTTLAGWRNTTRSVSSSPDPVSHSHPQPVSLSRKRCVTQPQTLCPNPRQLSKPSVQLFSSSVLIHHQPRTSSWPKQSCGADSSSHQRWPGWPDCWVSYMGVACHSASLNIPSSSPWCPVFVQVISHLPDKQWATNFSTSAMTSTRPSWSSFSTTRLPCSKMVGAQSRTTQSSPHR